MGAMVDGVWRSEDELPRKEGRFVRAETCFRGWITQDGGPGPNGARGFPAAIGRYHLYVSYACPWAHRTLIVRRLKNLVGAIGLSVTDAHMSAEGWTFHGEPGGIPDRVNGARRLHEIYAKAAPRYNGRVSVPVLWDKETATIVNNESSEIIRMFNTAFDHLDGCGAPELDFYPAELRAEIDGINDLVYTHVNNGVYRCGFAGTQEAYEEAFEDLFRTLDMIEELLDRQRYLAGPRLTEADWRLFTTLVRFDAVYFTHFKCNLRRIDDYPNLSNYLRELYQLPGVAETVDMNHIKRHYYTSHRDLNPRGIVPLGPELNFTVPHDRDRLSAEPLMLAAR